MASVRKICIMTLLFADVHVCLIEPGFMKTNLITHESFDGILSSFQASDTKNDYDESKVKELCINVEKNSSRMQEDPMKVVDCISRVLLCSGQPPVRNIVGTFANIFSWYVFMIFFHYSRPLMHLPIEFRRHFEGFATTKPVPPSVSFLDEIKNKEN